MIGAVALGGGLGAVARYLTIVLCGRLCGTAFPLGTLVVNILGCALMGILAALFARVWPADLVTRAFLTTGFLGGFTTFSAFSLDAIFLVERGALLAASLYVLGSVALSLLGFVLGLRLVRLI